MSKDARLKEETSRKVASAHHLLHCFSMPLLASPPGLQVHVSDHLQCFLSRVLHQGCVLRQLLNDHPGPLKTWIRRHWIKMSIYCKAYCGAIHSRQAITTSTHPTFRILSPLRSLHSIRQCATVLWLTTLSNAFTHWSLHHGTIVSSRLANPARLARTAVLLPIASLARRHWPPHHSWSRRPASGKSSPKNLSKSAQVKKALGQSHLIFT